MPILDQDAVHRTNENYWSTQGNAALGAIVLPRYGAFISEESCGLLGDISGQKVLEIGCGNGRSLEYLGKRGAEELWGMDLSAGQLERAKEHLAACGLSARLICSPMEAECGVPKEHFDLVCSIYAIGWTTDLEGTFRRVASYLKKDGVFVFSWSHPIHKCIREEDGKPVFSKCYFDESWYTVPAELAGGELTLSDRKLSTYVNALAGAGFLIEELVEQTDPELLPEEPEPGSLAQKAQRYPVTFVFKARKR